MRLKHLFFPAVVILSGCNLATNPATQPTATKSATAICATAGAALQAMVVAGAQGALTKLKSEAEILEPVCTAPSASKGITKAQADAYTAIISAAAPYLGVTK